MAVTSASPVGVVTREGGRCMYVGRCSCGTARSIEAEGSWNHQDYYHGDGIYRRIRHKRWFTLAPGWGENGELTALCQSCMKRVRLSQVDGKLAPEVTCDARCTGAIGPSCSCSCGGANHGRDHA